MKPNELTKEQRAAIRSLERAFKKCAIADLSFCGMDDCLHYATNEAIKAEDSGMGYCGCANAQQDMELMDTEVVGPINTSGSYVDSGGW